MTGTILSASGLQTEYGNNLVLRGADVALQEGEICGIIGPNGAGKTTLLNSLYGILPLRSGRILLEGEDITALSPRDRLRRGMCYVPQERNVFPNLSVMENLELAVTAKPEIRKSGQFNGRLEYVFELFPRLLERKSQAAGLMSGGEQRMVAIAIGLMANPKVLLLDEPTTGLAPMIVHQLMNTIEKLNKSSRISTIIVEQNIMSMLRVVHSLYILKDGRSSRCETPDAITGQKIWEYL